MNIIQLRAFANIESEPPKNSDRHISTMADAEDDEVKRIEDEKKEIKKETEQLKELDDKLDQEDEQIEQVRDEQIENLKDKKKLEEKQIRQLDDKVVDDAEKSKTTIPDLRSFVDHLWRDDKYAGIKGSVNEEIDALLKKIFEYVEILEKENGPRIAARFHGPNDLANAAGQVEGDIVAIKQVVQEGNLREKMTLVHNFGKNSCDLYWDTIFAYCEKDGEVFEEWQSIKHLLDEDDLIKRIETIEIKTGFAVKNLISACVDTNCKELGTMMYDTSEYPTFCHIVRLNKEGPIMTTRSGLKPKERTENSQPTKEQRWIARSDILPALSVREESWLKSNDLITDDGRVKWDSGFASSSTNPDGLYARMAKQFGRLSIAGPSAKLDLHLDVSLTFNGTLLFNNFMACVIWLGNPPDHSLHEMLLSAKGRGYEETFAKRILYDISIDPFTFLDEQVLEFEIKDPAAICKDDEYDSPKAVKIAVIVGIIILLGGGLVFAIYKMYKACKETARTEHVEQTSAYRSSFRSSQP